MHQAVDIMPTIDNADSLARLTGNLAWVINTYIGKCIVFLDKV